jgi:hypothetical protein
MPFRASIVKLGIIALVEILKLLLGELLVLLGFFQ